MWYRLTAGVHDLDQWRFDCWLIASAGPLCCSLECAHYCRQDSVVLPKSPPGAFTGSLRGSLPTPESAGRSCSYVCPACSGEHCPLTTATRTRWDRSASVCASFHSSQGTGSDGAFGLPSWPAHCTGMPFVPRAMRHKAGSPPGCWPAHCPGSWPEHPALPSAP